MLRTSSYSYHHPLRHTILPLVFIKIPISFHHYPHQRPTSPLHIYNVPSTQLCLSACKKKTERSHSCCNSHSSGFPLRPKDVVFRGQESRRKVTDCTHLLREEKEYQGPSGVKNLENSKKRSGAEVKCSKNYWIDRRAEIHTCSLILSTQQRHVLQQKCIARIIGSTYKYFTRIHPTPSSLVMSRQQGKEEEDDYTNNNNTPQPFVCLCDASIKETKNIFSKQIAISNYCSSLSRSLSRSILLKHSQGSTGTSTAPSPTENSHECQTLKKTLKGEYHNMPLLQGHSKGCCFDNITLFLQQAYIA